MGKFVSLFFLLPFLAAAQSPLPQSVYNDFANPSVSTINLPQGTFSLPAPLVLRRSNATVNFSGCTLEINPATGANDGYYPIAVWSTSVTSPTYPGGPGNRYISHATGSISECTTQLTMDPAEAVSLTPGETVLIWAGATPSDPVEPAAFIPATVASVDARGTITFTAPLGKNIYNYGSVQGIVNATSPSLQWKAGAWGSWPSGANFSKGFGIDHGIERFVGGMVHDVTLNDITLNLQTVDAAHSPNAMWDISAIAVNNLTVRNLHINNPHGNTVHFWRTFHTLVDGATFTGHGQNKIWNTSMGEAFALTAWGGDFLTYNNISVTGTDTTAFNTEVGVSNVSVNGLSFDVEFTSARNYSSSPTILGFHSPTTKPKITDASIYAITSGGTAHGYYTYDPLEFYGQLIFPGSSLTSWFDFGSQKFPTLAGTVQIGGIVYGPSAAFSTNVTLLHGAGSRIFRPPEGIYTAGRFRVTTLGSLRGVTDTQGGSYDWNAVTSGQWIPVLPNRWHQIGPGDANLAAYVNKGIQFWFTAPWPNDAIAEFEFTYLPKQ
jgi:hypothetical protein